MTYKDGKFRLSWAAAALGKDAGDAITDLTQLIGKRGFPQIIDTIGEVGNTMSNLGCHFPYLKVFKSKVSHMWQLPTNHVFDKCHLRGLRSQTRLIRNDLR